MKPYYHYFSLFLLAVGAPCFGSIAITTASLPGGTVGEAYSTAVVASNGCSPYKWAIASGKLPAGVTAKVSSTTTSLHLAGTPTTAATDSFTVKVTGCGGSISEKSYKVVIQVAPSHKLAITPTSLPNGTVGTAYSQIVKASGGCTPYKWAIASGALPAGVTAKVSSTTTSLDLTGTPTTAATDSFTVKVSACGGSSDQMAYKVVVQASTSGNPAISTASLPNGTVGTAYAAVVKASGGCTPYKWAIASGALPAGVKATTASTTTALSLSGTPTSAATDSFTVKVSGCNGGSAQASYKVVVQSSANHVVDLRWKDSTTSDVTGYNVYRSPDGSTWKRMNASLIASAQYADSTVANGSTYYYAATAVDMYGHESKKTGSIMVVVP